MVLPFDMSWGAGFMRNAAVHPWGPGDRTFGHSGWGGSCAFADPERKLGGAYVMNKQSTDLLGDRRAGRLIAIRCQRLRTLNLPPPAAVLAFVVVSEHVRRHVEL